MSDTKKPIVQLYTTNRCPDCGTPLKKHHTNRVGTVKVRYATCPKCSHYAKLIEYVC